MAISFTSTSSQYLDATSEFAALRTTATLSFWIQTTQVGNDTQWLAPGVTGIEENGGDDDIFWGFLNNNSGNSQMGLVRGDDVPFYTVAQVNTGAEIHIALTWNSTNAAKQIFQNGALVNSTTGTTTGDVTNTFSRIASIYDTSLSHTYLDGTLDDVRIYNRILTANEIAVLYGQRGGDDIREGLVTRYKMDQGSPSSSVSSVLDDTGANGASAVASPVYSESTIMRRRST